MGNIHIPVIVVNAFGDIPGREYCRQYGEKAKIYLGIYQKRDVRAIV